MIKPPQSVSMTDIARHLNISQATVSYVLSGRTGGSIGEKTRERVLEAAQQMGYRRNRAARALAGHGSHIIELCVYGFFPSYYAQVLEAYNLEFRPTSYELQIVNLGSSSEEDWTAADGAWPVDGIIAHTPLSATILSSLIQRGTPVVSISPTATKEVDHILVDSAPALLEGIRHLARGNQRVAFLSMWDADVAANHYHWDPRYHAYHQVMQEMGLPEEIITTPEPQNQTLRASVRERVRHYITHNGCPDAIFCFNDERAIGTLTALRDLNLRVPQDVMLLGCDGIEETEYHHPPISTIQYPFREVARLSWEFLQHRMKHPEAPLQSATLVSQLALRESSAYEGAATITNTALAD